MGSENFNRYYYSQQPTDAPVYTLTQREADPEATEHQCQCMKTDGHDCAKDQRLKVPACKCKCHVAVRRTKKGNFVYGK